MGQIRNLMKKVNFDVVQNGYYHVASLAYPEMPIFHHTVNQICVRHKSDDLCDAEA